MLVNLLPHTPDTEGILNARAFDRLAGATLDVFHTEPLPRDHPFWTHPRISVTPHISAETLRDESIVQIAGKIAALSRGEPIGGIVDFSRGY